MFNAVSELMEQGEAFSQALSPATLIYGNGRFPCKIGGLKFHEVYHEPGGATAVRELKATLRRVDVNPSLIFQRGQQVQIERKLRGAKESELLDLTVADANTSDATLIYLTLERQLA